MENAQRALPVVDDDSRPFWGPVVKDAVDCSCRSCGSPTPAGACMQYCRSENWPASRGAEGVIASRQTIAVDPRFPLHIALLGALDDDPRVRLTTNIVDVDIDELRVGMRVEPRFERCEDVMDPPLFAEPASRQSYPG